MADAVTNLSRTETLRRLRTFPGVLSGKVSDAGQEELLRELGGEAMDIIHEAYLVKSQGGTDAAGITWPPRKSDMGRKPAPNRSGRRTAPARQVIAARPIGIDTERLVKSFDATVGSADTILEPTANGVRGGSRVPYARHFAKARPILPPGDWPAPWVERLAAKLADGLKKLAARLVRG